jgi:hypothetical protein
MSAPRFFQVQFPAEEALINRNIAEIRAAYEPTFQIRVTECDGESLMGTCEMAPNRINVATQNDIIVAITGYN